MIKITYTDSEVGREDQIIGKINYDAELNNDATGYDVIDAILKVMKVAEYHPETIKRALREAYDNLTGENEEKDLNNANE